MKCTYSQFHSVNSAFFMIILEYCRRASNRWTYSEIQYFSVKWAGRKQYPVPFFLSLFMMLKDENECTICVNSPIRMLAHLWQWLTKCKWKCDNDHDRGTGNVQTLEQKCCQVESEHKDSPFDTLLFSMTWWPYKEQYIRRSFSKTLYIHSEGTYFQKCTLQYEIYFVLDIL